MYKSQTMQWLNRALVTETLPYEVPVIFSNDKFFQCVTKKAGNAELKAAIDKVLKYKAKFAAPYNYQIRKSDNKSTVLSIVHPLWQLEFCKLYNASQGALLAYCEKSEFSIRKPIAVATVFAEIPFDSKADSSKVGTVHADPTTEELDFAHLISYFTYGKYNLLSKFFESAEFVRLEAQYPYMRTLDVSKCFYNIYTHSIGWAIKGKDFIKQNMTAYSFENEFDGVMQGANYGETNGIVVGPEISRIFAEIILQQVDKDIKDKLGQKNLVHGSDYAVRRYVDDFSIFAKSKKDLDVIENVVGLCLEAYKLYLNDKKINTYERPFLSPLTIARSNIKVALKGLEAILFDADRTAIEKKHAIHQLTRDIRTIVKSEEIGFQNISVWTLGVLKRLIDHENAQLTKNGREYGGAWFDIVSLALRQIVYVCSVDYRVRTTYIFCQIVCKIFSIKTLLPKECLDSAIAACLEGHVTLLNNSPIRLEDDVQDCVEHYNILMCGALYIGESFLQHERVRYWLKQIERAPLTYFSYVSLKFCYLKQSTLFAESLVELNIKVENTLVTGKKDCRIWSEQYLLLMDYLSAPDLTEAKKCTMFKRKLGASITEKTMGELAEFIGFVDWDGVSVDHNLRRKQMRPIYAMA